jgi:uncharacterized membrane protein YfcA
MMEVVDWVRYWFMFPVSIMVATTAMLSGIGGAALFIPIFLIIFPLMGPEYPLGGFAATVGAKGTVVAIAVALLTETFGFSSGFVGYYRKRLIDFRSAVPFLAVSVPVAIAGALIVFWAGERLNENFIKGAYGVIMLIIAAILLRQVGQVDIAADPQSSAGSTVGGGDARPERSITSRDGRVYTYKVPRQGRGIFATAVGGLLTGMVGVGMGEVVVPQLVKKNRVPVAVAAATSVLIVIVTVAAASFTLIYQLIQAGGFGAVPWHIVCYTIPAVVIGGQIGPRLQGTVPQRTMEHAIGALFAMIGIAMLWIFLRTMM